MKDNVDKRVVEFEFDNSKFDKNVKKSTKTLNKLDETLQFKDVSKSLDEVKMKFSTLDVVFASTTKNITDRVVNLGIRLVKSLSIDNITAGWEKFGEKTVAVGTLMAQKLKVAGREIENYAEQMEVVNEQLDKLNWFTDETSYNFTDMVDNIGKFTAAGQDLDKSVEAMMGIANWAAVSGQNASTASRAMYQLSQALGKGYVQLIDWKSIQNANMDTQEFRQTVLDTAVELGELTKQGENFISKSGKKFNINQFSEQLNSKWFTSDVLTKTLQKYSGAVEKLYEITEKENITASKAIELYGDQFDELAIKAFKAAQEARTFSDAIKSVKDAVSTGWMTTAEMIFGSYDEAKEFWTELANELYDVFAESGNIRNSILEVWKALDGRSDLFTRGGNKQGAFWNLYDSIIAVRDIISDAWNTIFPKTEFEDENDQINDLGHNLKTVTTRFQKATKKVKDFLENNEDLRKILEGVFSVLKVILASIQALRYALDPLLYTIKQIVLTVGELFGNLGEQLASSTGYAEILYTIAESINKVLTNIFSAIDLPKVISKIASILSVLVNIIKDLFVAISNFLDSHLDLSKIIVGISNAIGKLTERIKTFFSQFKKGSKKTDGNNISNVIIGNKETNKNSGDVNKNLEETTEKNEKTLDLLDVLTEFAKACLALLKSLYSLATSIIKLASMIINSVASALEKIATWINGIVERQTDATNALKTFLKYAAIGFLLFEIIRLVINISWIFGYLKIKVWAFLDEAATALSRWGTSQIIKSIGDSILKLGASFMLIVSGILMISKLGIQWSDIAKAAVIFDAILLFTTLAIAFSKKLEYGTKIFQKGEGILQAFGNYTSLGELPRVLLSLGITFLLISKGLANLSKINESDFTRGISILILLLGSVFALQYASSKMVSGNSLSVRSLLPSALQIIAIAYFMKIIMNALLELRAALAELNFWETVGFVSLTGFFIAMIASLIVINNISKKASKITDNSSKTTITLGLKIGFTLIGIATLMLSIIGFVITIAVLGEQAKEGLRLVKNVLIGIFTAVLVLEIAINAIDTGALIFDKKKKQLLGNKNPITGIIKSIAFFLLSVTISLAILQKIEVTQDMLNILYGVAGFITVLLVILGLISLILKDRTKDKKSSKVSNSNAISEMVKALSALLLSMSVILTVVSLLPDYNKVKQVGLTLMVFIIIVLGMFAVIASQLKGKSSLKVSAGMALFSANIMLISASLVALSIALKVMNSFIQPDWEKYGYLAAVLGLFIALGAVVGYVQIAALGMLEISLLTIVMGVGFAALGYGLSKLVGPMNQLTWPGVLMLLSLLGIQTAAGMIRSISFGKELMMILSDATLGLGFASMGDGLSKLVGPMNQLTWPGILMLLSLLGMQTAASSIRSIGFVWELKQILSDALLGLGFASMGDGLSKLVGPMNQLTWDGVNLFIRLLTFSGLHSVSLLKVVSELLSGKALGAGLRSLGEGLSVLNPQLKELRKEGVDNLIALMNALSRLGGEYGGGWNFILGWFGTDKADKLKKALNNLSEGLHPLITQLNNINGVSSGLTAIGDILQLLSGGYFNLTPMQNLISLIKELASIDVSYTSLVLADLNELIARITHLLEIEDSIDLTIKPIIDLSDFDPAYNKLSSMLSSLSGVSPNLSSDLAYSISNAKAANIVGESGITNNSNTTYNDTYNVSINVETNDPYELAEEVDRILQTKYRNAKVAVGSKSNNF